MTTTLALWRPLLEPLPAYGYEWLLLIPVVVLMVIAYNAIRCEDMTRYWRSVAQMAAGLLLGLALLAGASWAMVALLEMLPQSG